MLTCVWNAAADGKTVIRGLGLRYHPQFTSFSILTQGRLHNLSGPLIITSLRRLTWSGEGRMHIAGFEVLSSQDRVATLPWVNTLRGYCFFCVPAFPYLGFCPSRAKLNIIKKVKMGLPICYEFCLVGSVLKGMPQVNLRLAHLGMHLGEERKNVRLVCSTLEVWSSRHRETMLSCNTDSES